MSIACLVCLGWGPSIGLTRVRVSRSVTLTVERDGRLDVVMDKIDQLEQETPTSNSRKMIDDFRFRGSSTCRHMDVHHSDGGAI